MSNSEYGSVALELPDRPLIVKCTFDRAMKRISFTSACNCRYDLLRVKLEQSFSLSATTFTIAYRDDDGEVTEITNDFDLVEAIHYFQAGDDSVSNSAGSIASGRSGSGRRITLRVYITVDYDGPSLSDTSSLASLDDFPRARSWNQGSLRSFSLRDGDSVSGYVGPQGEPEDDAVTISSRDHQSVASRPLGPSSTASSRPLPQLPSNYRLPGHSVPSVATSPPSPPLSDTSHHTPLTSPPTTLVASQGSPLRDPHVNVGRSARGTDVASQASRPSLAQPPPRGSSRGATSPRPPPPPLPPRQSQGTPPATTVVFERLKQAEQTTASPSYALPTSLAHTERGARWLQDQNDRVMRTMIGEVAESISSGASFVFGEDTSSIGDGDIRGDLALQQDPRGRYYYTFSGVESNDQASHRFSTDFSEVPTSPVLASDIQSQGNGRPLSHHLAWIAKQQIPAAGSSKSPFEDPKYVVDGYYQSVPSGSSSKPLPRITTSTPSQIPGANTIPPELLPFVSGQESISPPEELTNCSACATPLDYFRYICSVCGPKSAKRKGMDIPSPTSSCSMKGKGRAVSNEGEYLSAGYPPRSSPASPSSPSWSFLGDREHSFSPLSTISSFLKGKHQRVLRKSPSRTSLNTASGHGSSPGSGYISAADTAVNTGSPGSPTNKKILETLEKGYELCSNCIYTAGVAHAHEEALTSTEPSPTVVSSPLSSPEETERSIRSAVTRKAKNKWHAFIEKVWNGLGWSDIEQEDNAVCAICKSALGGGRYKCASCPQFNLCNACYTQVHEIHPSHAFLVVPVKPAAKPLPEPPVEPPNQDQGELSLLHPGVTCHHCRQAIVGARFHCAICESVDICQNCEAAGLPGNLTTSAEGEHDASHVMIKIPYPLESTEVALASSRARVLWSKRDAATIEAINKRIAPLSRSNSAGSSYAATVIASGRRLQNPLDHGIQCNGCTRNIVGTRYQCASCPSLPKAYHLCAECEKMSHVVHPKEHVFLKFNRRVDHPVGNPGPLLPVLYEESTDTEELQVPENLQSLVHSSTYCDRCMLPIRGAWFRCVYCGQDMCDEHEQLHNQDHVCMVLKAKVDLVQLRLVTDIDHPDQTVALIPAVYDTP